MGGGAVGPGLGLGEDPGAPLDDWRREKDGTVYLFMVLKKNKNVFWDKHSSE